jgi:hypothetical protein
MADFVAEQNVSFFAELRCITLYAYFLAELYQITFYAYF